MHDEDDLWLQALAGHTEAGEPGDLSVQGAALRAAIRARAVADAGDVRVIDPAREAALIARARAAGLLPPAATPAKWRELRWVALAAAVVCVAIGVSLQMRTGPATIVVRGDTSAVVHLRTRHPLRLKQDLLRELNAVGVRATGYESLGRQGIDAEVPVPLPEAVRRVLERHAIPQPAGNVLQLDIESDRDP
jgi:hypothetical protein